MYKNKIIIITSVLLIFVLSFFCFYQTNKFLNLSYQRQKEKGKLQDLENLSLCMKRDNFIIPKSAKEIFKNSSNLKEFIEKSANYFSLHKIFLKNKFSDGNFYKQEELNLKFSCKNELQIYKFLQHLYLAADGFVIFEKIKIQKSDNKNFSVEVKCRIFLYSECYKKYVTISEHEKFYPIKKWMHLFEYEKKKHMLNGVMQHRIAFIDNSEKRVGDEVGEYEIFKIKDNEVELLRRENLKTVHLGEKF